MVNNETIAATLAADATPEDAAKRLLALADEAGGRDNITVLLVRFDVVPGSGGEGRSELQS
jgi:serine/threonine protein phosphatase PrpC